MRLIALFLVSVLTVSTCAFAGPRAPASAETPPRLQQLEIGYRLSRWAEEHRDATAMYVAALVLGNTRSFLASKAPSAADGMLSKQTLLDRARMLAAGDRYLLARIDSALADGSKGVVGDPLVVSLTLNPGQSRILRFAVRAGEALDITLMRDGLAYPVLELQDGRGRAVHCIDRGQTVNCAAIPAFEGVFQLSVTNSGRLVSRSAVATK